MQSNNTSKKTRQPAEQTAAAADSAAAEITAKPRTSRSSKTKNETGDTVSAKRHRKAASPVHELETAAPGPEAQSGSQSSTGITYERIASLAHSYWVERGYRHESPEEDWFRAERELGIGA